MWYDPRAYFIQVRDVIAAWLLCIGMAGCGLASELAWIVYEALLLE